MTSKDGLFIPRFIWENTKLSLQEKCLLAVIHQDEICHRTNKELADFMQLSQERTRKIIQRMAEQNLILVTVERDGRNQVVDRRMVCIAIGEAKK